MHKKTFLTVLIFLLSLMANVAAWSESPLSLMKQAEKLYEEEQPEAAVEKYMQVIESGLESAPLYYNLANAYYKEGKIGDAILYYHRAQKLSPRDTEIEENLAYCRTLVVDESGHNTSISDSWLTAIPNKFSFNEICIAACGIFILAIFFFCITTFSDALIIKNISRRAGWLLIIVWILLSSILAYRVYTEKSMPGGVILSPRVEVRAGPGESYSPVFILHEGAEAIIEKTKDDWYKISYPSVGSGWVHKTDLSKI